MKLMETSANVTGMVKAAISAVEGKEYHPALIGLLTCVPRPTADEVRKIVARIPLMHRLIGNVRVNEEGKQVAIREGVDDNDDARWSALVARTFARPKPEQARDGCGNGGSSSGHLQH